MSGAASPILLSTPPPLAGRRPERLRLLAGPAGPMLLFAEAAPGGQPWQPPPVVVSSLAAGAAAARQVASLPRHLPGAVPWDAGFTPDGRLRIVRGVFGGATHALTILGPAGEGALRSASPHDDLLDPRFGRGRAAPHVTALVGESQVVAFLADAAGAHGPARVLARGAMLDRALLVGTPRGAVLLHRQAEFGETRGGTLPGRVVLQLLGPDLAPAGAAWTLPLAAPVHGFDADAMGDGVAVLATTPAGFALARILPGEAPTLLEQAHAGPLVQPAIAVSGTTAQIGFLGPDGAVLVGQAGQG